MLLSILISHYNDNDEGSLHFHYEVFYEVFFEK